MNAPQKPKSKIAIVIVLVLLSLSTLMCLVYGMVQRTQAVHVESKLLELEQLNSDLNKVKETLAMELDIERVKVAQILKDLNECQSSENK